MLVVVATRTLCGDASDEVQDVAATTGIAASIARILTNFRFSRGL